MKKNQLGIGLIIGGLSSLSGVIPVLVITGVWSVLLLPIAFVFIGIILIYPNKT